MLGIFRVLKDSESVEPTFSKLTPLRKLEHQRDANKRSCQPFIRAMCPDLGGRQAWRQERISGRLECTIRRSHIR